MATAILAAPAFFETTRPIFVEYRGEWALISVSDICMSRYESPQISYSVCEVLCRHLAHYRCREFPLAELYLDID